MIEGCELRELQARIAGWADEVFPDRTAHDAAVKLVLEEIPEFLRSPNDPLEYADLVILILDIAYLRGIDIQDAVLKKMGINENRRWNLDPTTRLMHHIKE